MTTQLKIQLTSTELGTLWMSYQAKVAMLKMLEKFTDDTKDSEAKNILNKNLEEGQKVVSEIIRIFDSQGAVIPVAFDERDIIKDTPILFDDAFHVMFLRQISKMNMAFSSLYKTMSFMKEVREVLKQNHDISNTYYDLTTEYLLQKGVLARPPYVTMPQTIEFIEDKNYMSGFNPFADKRALNTIEVGFITQLIEDNIFGMQLMTGFAQVATEGDVRAYFIEGKELAKKIVANMTDILLQSDIQPPSTWAGKATDATQPPFSDKIMMFFTSLISSFALGLNALGTSFSLRSDLPAKMAIISKDTFDYAKKGSKITIKHKWLEEPPQMEDRNQLTKSKK